MSPAPVAREHRLSGVIERHGAESVVWQPASSAPGPLQPRVSPPPGHPSPWPLELPRTFAKFHIKFHNARRKDPPKAYSLLKALTSAFTIENLHDAKLVF